MLRTPPSPAGH